MPFDMNAVGISQKLYDAVVHYIEKNYIGTEHFLCASVPHDSVCLSEAKLYKEDGAKRKTTSGSCGIKVKESVLPPCAVNYAEEQKLSVAMGADFDSDALKRMLDLTDAGFSETLLKLIDKTGKKDSEIYKKAGVDRKHFSKIRNNPSYKPSKQTALAFAIALELDLEATKDLISRAGFTLSHSSKADIIIEYFIINGTYDIFLINETLFAFDQNILGA